MRNSRFPSFHARVRRLALFAIMAALTAPLLAQYIGSAPPPPAALGAGMVESSSAALARNLRLIALNPRDFAALVAAGRAALDLGDYQAAVGFFGRAEEVRPSDPAPKIGMGAATVEMGDARGALAWFVQAQQLGASRAQLGADRGLAQDLLGNQAAAQLDYEAALAGPDRDEARRRLALSLAISRDPARAMLTLQPLLNRRDPAAQRVRAFIFALGGDRAGARRAIDSAMPGSAARIDPFFAILPTLSVEQKAAAVHLGVFPTASEIKLAAVEPLRVAPPLPVGLRAAPKRASERARARPPKKQKVAVGRRVALAPTPLDQLAPTSPPVSLPTPTPAPTPTPTPTPTPIMVVATPIIAAPPPIILPSPPPPTVVAATPLPASTTSDLLPGDRLSGIDKLLARTSEASPPPAPRPRVERPAAPPESRKVAAKKAADLKQAAADKKAAADDKKQREAIGVAGTNWVQIAGGTHADRMAVEFKKRAAQSAALRKRGGFVTKGKDYFRLLTGPFDSKSDAQDFANALAKDGVDGFSWTRTPATIKIEKIAPK